MVYLFLLLSAVNYKAQAEALFDYVASEGAGLRDYRLAADGEGGLWVASNVGGDLYISRITPQGKPAFERILIEDTLDTRLENQVAFDSRGNAWLVCQVVNETAPNQFDMDDTLTPLKPGERSLASLVRVTPQGEVQRYSTWPELSPIRNYIGVLPGDSLIIVGISGSSSAWVMRCLVTSQGIVPAGELYRYMNAYSLFSAASVGSPRDYSQNVLDWSKGWGIRAEIYWFQSYADRGPDKLNLYRLSLRPEDNFSFKSIGVYNWRNYVWRTYKNSWIRYMTFAPYRDGGWILAIPDPDERSITHLVRLNQDGIPLNPDSLNTGGVHRARTMRRLPEGTVPQLDLVMWRTAEQKLDSARVLFWGADDKGNLYAYRKVIR